MTKMWLGFLLIFLTFSALAYLNYSLPSKDYVRVNSVTNIQTGKAICDNFVTQTDAQQFFDNNGGISGRYASLDKDKDGVVCEGLPK